MLLFAGLVVTSSGTRCSSGWSPLVAHAGGLGGQQRRRPATVVAVSIGMAGGLGALLVTIASLAFVSAVLAMLYLDLRVRREGLDLWLRPALRPSGPAPR